MIKLVSSCLSVNCNVLKFSIATPNLKLSTILLDVKERKPRSKPEPADPNNENPDDNTGKKNKKRKYAAIKPEAEGAVDFKNYEPPSKRKDG